MYSPAGAVMVVAQQAGGPAPTLFRLGDNGKDVWQSPGLVPVGFSPDGKRLACAGNGSLTFLDTATGKPIGTPVPVVGLNTNNVNQFGWGGFSDAGRTAAWVASDPAAPPFEGGPCPADAVRGQSETRSGIVTVD
jgi:hypothetical protein